MVEQADKSSDNPVPSDDESLIAFLSERDVQCPVCQYNLRGLIRPRCPECGTALRLTVGTVDAYAGTWIAMTCTLFSVGGVGVLFIYACGRDGAPQFSHFWQGACFYGVMACAPASAVAIFFRRRFQRLSMPVQRLISLTIMALALLVLVGAISAIG